MEIAGRAPPHLGGMGALVQLRTFQIAEDHHPTSPERPLLSRDTDRQPILKIFDKPLRTFAAFLYHVIPTTILAVALKKVVDAQIHLC